MQTEQEDVAPSNDDSSVDDQEDVVDADFEVVEEEETKESSK